MRNIENDNRSMKGQDKIAQHKLKGMFSELCTCATEHANVLKDKIYDLQSARERRVESRWDKMEQQLSAMEERVETRMDHVEQQVSMLMDKIENQLSVMEASVGTQMNKPNGHTTQKYVIMTSKRRRDVALTP